VAEERYGEHLADESRFRLMIAKNRAIGGLLARVDKNELVFPGGRTVICICRR